MFVLASAIDRDCLMGELARRPATDCRSWIKCGRSVGVIRVVLQRRRKQQLFRRGEDRRRRDADENKKSTHSPQVSSVRLAGSLGGDDLGDLSGSSAGLEGNGSGSLLDVPGVGILVSENEGDAVGVSRGLDVDGLVVSKTGVLERVAGEHIGRREHRMGESGSVSRKARKRQRFGTKHASK